MTASRIWSAASTKTREFFAVRSAVWTVAEAVITPGPVPAATMARGSVLTVIPAPTIDGTAFRTARWPSSVSLDVNSRVLIVALSAPSEAASTESMPKLTTSVACRTASRTAWERVAAISYLNWSSAYS